MFVFRSLGSWKTLYQKMGGGGEEEGDQVSKESELLIANLGSEQLRKNNILLDHNTMKLIGILHESLVSLTMGGRQKGEREVAL